MTLSLAAAQVEARPGSIGDAVDAHVRRAHAAAKLGAQLLVFPELSLTGYSRVLTQADALTIADARLAPLAESARRLGITLVVGAPLRGQEKLLIGSFCFRADGRAVTYTKRYLHEGEESAFEAGNGGALLEVAGTQVGLAICAEINHASHVVDTVAAGAQVYAASCFFTPRGYSADCRKLQGYAALHDMAVVMANYTGTSGEFDSAGGSTIWDDTGALVASAPPQGECLVVAERDEGRWHGRWVALDDVEQ